MKHPLKWTAIIAVAALAVFATTLSVQANERAAPSSAGAPAAPQQGCTDMQAGAVAWVTLTDDGDIDEQVPSYPAGTSLITPVFEYNCVPRQVTIVTIFTLNGEPIFTDKESLRATNGRGRYGYPLGTTDDTPMDDGEWGVMFYNNKTLLTEGTIQVGSATGQAGETATVSGKVTDQRTKRPIRGTVVLVLQPGIEVQDWIDGGQADEDVFTAGKSDTKGDFTLANPLARGEAYSLVIVARGYRPLARDGFIIDDEQPDPVLLDIKMRK